MTEPEKSSSHQQHAAAVERFAEHVRAAESAGPPARQGQPDAATLAEVARLHAAKGPDGRRLYEVDPAYRREVEAKRVAAFTAAVVRPERPLPPMPEIARRDESRERVQVRMPDGTQTLMFRDEAEALIARQRAALTPAAQQPSPAQTPQTPQGSTQPTAAPEEPPRPAETPPEATVSAAELLPAGVDPATLPAEQRAGLERAVSGEIVGVAELPPQALHGYTIALPEGFGLGAEHIAMLHTARRAGVGQATVDAFVRQMIAQS